MSCIDLSVGGWDGWLFCRYGKSKQWRLVSPDEENYTPKEILEIRPAMLDLNYYKLRISQLEAQKGLTLSREDVSVIHALQRLVERLSVFPADGSQGVACSVLPDLPGKLLDFKKAIAG